MIKAILGVPGSGKTLYTLFLMGQYVAAGRPVATNIRLTPQCPFYDKVALLDDDADEFPVCREPSKRERRPYLAFWHYLQGPWAIFIDEADNYWDAAAHKEIAEDTRLYFKQHRKLDHDIFLMCQNLNNIYVRIRRMIQSFVLCEWNRKTVRMFQHLPIEWSRFLRAEFADERFTPDSFMGEGYFSYGEAEQMFGWYNTKQLIGSMSNYSQWIRTQQEARNDFTKNHHAAIGEARRIDERRGDTTPSAGSVLAAS